MSTHRFVDGHVGERRHVVAGGVRGNQADRRTPHLQRLQDPDLQALRPLAAVEPSHDLAEHRVAQVGVVVAVVWRQHPLRLVPAVDELVAVGVGQRVPDVADRFALHPGLVAEHLPDGDAAVLALRDVRVDGVVEGQLALVAQRHDQHGREGLGVRGDEELRVARPAADRVSRGPRPRRRHASGANRHVRRRRRGRGHGHWSVGRAEFGAVRSGGSR